MEKPGGKSGKGIKIQKLLQKDQGGEPAGMDRAKPEILVFSVDVSPFFQDFIGNAIGFQDFLQCHGPGEPGFQDKKNERQRIMTIGYDKIRQDGMCMTAGTTHTADSEDGRNNITVNEGHDMPVIRSKKTTLAYGITERTPLFFRHEFFHKRFEQALQR